MKWYIDTLQTLLSSPYKTLTRAKVKGKQIEAIKIPPVMFKHDMRDGFPLLTTKFVPLRLVASELQWFLSGSTRKEPLHQMDNHIWDEWHIDEDENELGRVYGAQWVSWKKYKKMPYSGDLYYSEVNQVQNIINQLRKDPTDRRMICTAWNPGEIDQMALPTCHVMWQITYYGSGVIGLHWTQRSCDFMLGVPFNIASYGLLLKLIAKTTGFAAGPLSGSLVDCHMYTNHINSAKIQIMVEVKKLPKIRIITQDKTSFDIFKWSHNNLALIDYDHGEKLPMEVAI